MPQGVPFVTTYSSVRLINQVFHHHDRCLEIQIAGSAPLLYQVKDKEVLVNKYTALLIRPPHPHLPREVCGGGGVADKFCVLLDLGRCRRMLRGLNRDMRRFILRSGPEAYCTAPLGGSFSEIKIILNTITREFKRRPLGWEECVRFLGESLVVFLYRAFCGRHGKSPDGAEGDLREQITALIMRERDAGRDCLAAIAKRLGYSYSYTSFLCRKILGTSLREARSARQIETARQLLEGTSQQKIGIVAAQAGFADLPNFYHAFRKHTGSTPDEYRKFYQSH